jgi:hypothetical protein
MSAIERPVLSVVVACVSDTALPHTDPDYLAECLEALTKQAGAPPLEIIVPMRPGMPGTDAIKARFPDVLFVTVPNLPIRSAANSREHHDVLRARGLCTARGEFVALIEDHACADERWCASLVAALRNSAAGVGGAIENKVDRPLNWAVYYCDFGRYQNPLPAGPSSRASDANAAYRRSALESIRSVWKDTFREVDVNAALLARGEQIALAPEAIVHQNRNKLRFGAALSERFVWGRSYAANRIAGRRQRLMYAALSPLLPALLLARMTVTARHKRRLFSRFITALPLTVMLVTAWSLGEGVGYLAGLGGRRVDGDG